MESTKVKPEVINASFARVVILSASNKGGDAEDEFSGMGKRTG